MVTLAFINPSRKFELELLASDYDSGSVLVDASAPSIEVRKTSAPMFNALVDSRSLVKGLRFTIPFVGIGYDSGAVAMSEVASELRSLSKNLAKRL